MKKYRKWSRGVLTVLSGGLVLQTACIDTLVAELTNSLGGVLLETLINNLPTL